MQMDTKYLNFIEVKIVNPIVYEERNMNIH